MAATSKIPWDKLKADTLRAICRDFGANPGKRKREGMLEFLRAVETTGLDEALKLNIEDKDESAPRRPSTKRARPAEEQPAGAAPPAESAPEGAGRPKRKAAPAPATEAPVKSRGKKAKTDAAAPAASAPVSKGKKGTEKKATSADDEAAKEQEEADEVDALADEPAENGAAGPSKEAPNETGPNATPGGVVVIESSKVEAVVSQAA